MVFRKKNLAICISILFVFLLSITLVSANSDPTVIYHPNSSGSLAWRQSEYCGLFGCAQWGWNEINSGEYSQQDLDTVSIDDNTNVSVSVSGSLCTRYDNYAQTGHRFKVKVSDMNSYYATLKYSARGSASSSLDSCKFYAGNVSSKSWVELDSTSNPNDGQKYTLTGNVTNIQDFLNETSSGNYIYFLSRCQLSDAYPCLNLIHYTYFLEIDNTGFPPEITLNYPPNGSTGISLSPILNVTATDLDGDDMNVSFYTRDFWNLSAASYDGSIAALNTNPTDMFFKPDGTKLYEAGTGIGSRDFYQYSCSNAWDLSSCSYDGVSIYTNSPPTGMFFKSDGTKLYEVDGSNFYQYSCSNAWDLSSCSYDNVNLECRDYSRDMFFKSDGTKLYEVGNSNYKFYQYSCSNAWDLSSCSYDGVNLGAQDAEPIDMFFNSDGTKLYEAGADGDHSKGKFYQYSCSNAWDLSSCSYDNINISTHDTDTVGMFFKPDGTKLYEIGSDYYMFYQSTFTLSNLLNTSTNVANGSDATYEWSGLSEKTTYDWYVNVTDGHSTTKSDVWNFTTGDFTPPYFTVIPADDTITYGTDWSGVDFDASDTLSSIDTWSINDTTNFNINPTGYLDDNPTLLGGTYKVNVSVNDTFANINSTIYTLTVEPNILSGSLTGNDGTYSTSNITIDFSESNSDDGDVTYKLYRNGTYVKDIVDGETYETELPVGTYEFIVNSTGGTNYDASSIIDSTIVSMNKGDPKTDWSFNFDPSLPTYGEESNVTLLGCQDSIACKLFFNDNEVSNPHIATLPAGSHEYKANTTGNENWSSVSFGPYEYNVSKAIPSLSISLGLPEGGVEIANGVETSYPRNVTINASETNTGDGDLVYNLFIGGDNMASGSDIKLNKQLAVGEYEAVYNSTGGTNYTNNSITKDIVITKGVPTMSLNFSNVTYPNSVNLQASESNIGDSDISYNLYIDGELETSGGSIDITKELSAGTYTIVYNSTGGNNWTDKSIEKKLKVSKASPNIDINFSGNGTEVTNKNYTIESGKDLIIEAIIDITKISQIKDSLFNLYQDSVEIGSLVNNIISYTLNNIAPGEYYYNSTWSGNENYTAFTRDPTVTSEDTLNPNVTLTNPADNLKDNISTQYFTAEHEDSYELKNTTLYVWNSTGDLTNQSSTSLSGTYEETNITIVLPYKDVYEWNYYTCDTSGNCDWAENNYTLNYTSFADTTPPKFTTIPADDTISYGNDWAGVTFEADEPVTWSINNTEHFEITNGNLNDRNILATGTYKINVTIKDAGDNRNSTIYTLTVNKAIPTLTLVLTNSTYPNKPIINASESNTGDNGLIYNLYINGELKTSGSTFELSPNSAADTYDIEYNTTGGANYSSNTVTGSLTVSKGSPTAQITNDKTWSETYPETIDIGYSESNIGDNDVSYDLYRDNNLISPGSSELSAGSYDYVLNTTGGQNWSSTSLDTETLTISKASVNIDIYFSDGTTTVKNSDLTMEYGNDLNVTAKIDIGRTSQIQDSLFDLYKNGTEVGSYHTSYIEYINTSLPVGAYYFNSTWSGNENYTAFTRDPTVTVEDTTPPEFTETLNDTSIVLGEDWSGGDFNSNENVTWSINDTSHYNINSTGYLDDSDPLEIGEYPVEITITDNSGNTNSTTFKLTVSGETEAPYLNMTKPENKLYEFQTNEKRTIPLEFITYDVNTSVDTCWYNLKYKDDPERDFGDYRDNTIINCSENETTFDVGSDGYYKIELYSNDTYGNTAMDNEYFQVEKEESVLNPPSGGGGGGVVIPPEEETPENITAGICGNRKCEEGETPFNCPSDCKGGFNLDTLIFPCFAGTDIGNWLGIPPTKEASQLCIYNRSPILFWGALSLIIVGLLLLFSRTEKGEELIEYPQKIYKSSGVPKYVKSMKRRFR